MDEYTREQIARSVTRSMANMIVKNTDLFLFAYQMGAVLSSLGGTARMLEELDGQTLEVTMSAAGFTVRIEDEVIYQGRSSIDMLTTVVNHVGRDTLTAMETAARLKRMLGLA